MVCAAMEDGDASLSSSVAAEGAEGAPVVDIAMEDEGPAVGEVGAGGGAQEQRQGQQQGHMGDDASMTSPVAADGAERADVVELALDEEEELLAAGSAEYGCGGGDAQQQQHMGDDASMSSPVASEGAEGLADFDLTLDEEGPTAAGDAGQGGGAWEQEQGQGEQWERLEEPALLCCCCGGCLPGGDGSVSCSSPHRPNPERTREGEEEA